MEEFMRYSSPFLIPFLLFSFICIAGVPVNEVNRDEVLNAGPEWKEKYDTYQPDPDRIEALKSKLGDVRIDIYLGLWCPDSRNNVPPFIKTLEATGLSVPVRFLSVERKPGKEVRYYSDKFEVEKVPTFIFYRSDREIGRIVENPKTGLLEDTIEILSR
jgi:hypothetical protein